MNIRSYCTEYYLLSGTQKNNIGAILKGALFDSCVHKFVLYFDLCAHHCAHNLSSPANLRKKTHNGL